LWPIKGLKDEDQTVHTAAKESLTLIKKKLGPKEKEWEKIVQKRGVKTLPMILLF
jgi:hypothetical protein